MAKYLKIGTVRKSNQGGLYIDFDKGNMRDFIDVLNKYGADHLKGLDKKEIWEKDKQKAFPSLSAGCFAPKESAPHFIAYDISMKIEE